MTHNECRERRFVSHGGDVWGFARKYNIPLEEVLDFSGPINHLGPSPKALESVKENSKLIKFYPDPNPVELCNCIAKYVNQPSVTSDNIILGNGSIELIYMITEIFSKTNFNAVVPVPSFTEYEKAALRLGGQTIYVPLPSDFSMENEKIKKAITPDTKIVSICNPHSPSGRLYLKDEILDLVEYCQEKNVVFSIDENYIEFTDKEQTETMAGYVNKYENLFVIRSVTKFYGMPGIRFGYGVAAKSLIDQLLDVRQPWSINGLAGSVTLAAFSDHEFIENTKRTIAQERVKFAKQLNEISGLQVFPSDANFLLVKITSRNITSTKIKEELAKMGMLIRDCCTFVGLDNTYFRVTVRSDKDNQKLVDAVKTLMSS
ncbi:MAG: histidinol-phosphate aminotransferase family protein [Candidatus Bathyarchaeota archaeon]|nr:histidinol-phosphate aminotransferase family protein [Candidatus Termiticorpusculum sp.]